MKAVLSFFLSILLAACLCLLLVLTGVLRLGSDLNPSGEKGVDDAGQHVFPILREDSTPSGETIVEAFASAPMEQEPAPSPPVTLPASDGKLESPPARQDTYTKVHFLLSTSRPEDAAEIEDRLMELLNGLGVGEKERESYLRMAFWKNFVTLQRDWLPEEQEGLRAAFMREKAIKRVGFAAKGLPLMKKELEEAESRFRSLLEHMQTAASRQEE
jgi:hypothetical protein